MMRHLAVQQALCGATLLAGQGSDQKGAECVAICGSAIGVLMMAPGYDLTGGPKAWLAAWFATLAALGEARRRDNTLAAKLGIALVGLSGVQNAVTPRGTLGLHGTDTGVSDLATALLALAGANQIANVVYLTTAGKRGHARGLVAHLLVNAAACVKFGLRDATRASCQRSSSLGYGIVGSLLAALVAKRL